MFVAMWLLIGGYMLVCRGLDRWIYPFDYLFGYIQPSTSIQPSTNSHISTSQYPPIYCVHVRACVLLSTCGSMFECGYAGILLVFVYAQAGMNL